MRLLFPIIFSFLAIEGLTACKSANRSQSASFDSNNIKKSTLGSIDGDGVINYSDLGKVPTKRRKPIYKQINIQGYSRDRASWKDGVDNGLYGLKVTQIPAEATRIVIYWDSNEFPAKYDAIGNNWGQLNYFDIQRISNCPSAAFDLTNEDIQNGFTSKLSWDFGDHLVMVRVVGETDVEENGIKSKKYRILDQNFIRITDSKQLIHPTDENRYLEDVYVTDKSNDATGSFTVEASGDPSDGIYGFIFRNIPAEADLIRVYSYEGQKTSLLKIDVNGRSTFRTESAWKFGSTNIVYIKVMKKSMENGAETELVLAKGFVDPNKK